MAIDPYRYIIVPRFVAALICIPILSCVFITVGIFGGYFVGGILFGVSPGSYFGGMYDNVLWRDILMSVLKGIAFALITIWVATTKGFYLHLEEAGAHGSEGVSKVTTQAVVVSSITVLFADYIISSIIFVRLMLWRDKQTKIEIIVGFFMLIGLACISYIAVQLGDLQVLGQESYIINARFTSASGLRTGAYIEAAGVRIGTVDSIEF